MRSTSELLRINDSQVDGTGKGVTQDEDLVNVKGRRWEQAFRFASRLDISRFKLSFVMDSVKTSCLMKTETLMAVYRTPA